MNTMNFVGMGVFFKKENKIGTTTHQLGKQIAKWKGNVVQSLFEFRYVR